MSLTQPSVERRLPTARTTVSKAAGGGREVIDAVAARPALLVQLGERRGETVFALPSAKSIAT